jgi:hypothetical protein
MEKSFAFGISSIFATTTAGALSAPLFAQADALSFLGLAERLGLGAAIAILGYLIIIKIIDVFERTLLTRLNTHDDEMKGKLSEIRKTVNAIENHVSGVRKKESADRQ